MMPRVARSVSVFGGGGGGGSGGDLGRAACSGQLGRMPAGTSTNTVDGLKTN